MVGNLVHDPAGSLEYLTIRYPVDCAMVRKSISCLGKTYHGHGLNNSPSTLINSPSIQRIESARVLEGPIKLRGFNEVETTHNFQDT